MHPGSSAASYSCYQAATLTLTLTLTLTRTLTHTLTRTLTPTRRRAPRHAVATRAVRCRAVAVIAVRAAARQGVFQGTLHLRSCMARRTSYTLHLTPYTILLPLTPHAKVDAAFAQRLLATSAGGKKLLDAACKGRLIGRALAQPSQP